LVIAMESSTRRFVIHWVLATFVGWIVGVAVIIVLAGAVDALHLNDSLAIGVGMGLSIGFAQWLTARRYFGMSSQWLWASVVGIGAPWIVGAATGYVHGGVQIPTLTALAAFGGFVTGAWQRRLLPRTIRSRWIITSVVAWSAAAVLPIAIMTSGHPSSLLGVIRNIGGLAGGGGVLGLITGFALKPAVTDAPPTSYTRSVV
jgi:hypothetical protein